MKPVLVITVGDVVGLSFFALLFVVGLGLIVTEAFGNALKRRRRAKAKREALP